MNTEERTQKKKKTYGSGCRRYLRRQPHISYKEVMANGKTGGSFYI